MNSNQNQDHNADSHQNNNIILKNEETINALNNEIMQKIKNETIKADPLYQNPSLASVQTPSEVFLSLGLKDVLSTENVQDDKDFKEFVKNAADDPITRASISHISEFLRIRPGNNQTPLVTVNPQAISQTPVRNLVCRDCGKTFNSMTQMNNHDCPSSLMNEVSETEIKEDPLQVNGNAFSCDICNKQFKRKEHLFQHRKLHTGERPYVCQTCAKAFSRKEHLVRHVVSHTGQKMHECEMCGKCFSRKDNLHKHRKTHGISGPYICETCGKSFVVKHYYLMHLTTHAPATQDGVIASDPLPYKCDICHKAFSVKNYLTTHKLRHRPKTNATTQSHQVQHQVQEGTSNNINVTNATNVSNGSSNSNHQINNSIINIQNSVIRDQQNESFANNQYQGNVSQYQ